jgi:hypothetical protein
MRTFIFAAIGLAMFASPAAAEHLYSDGHAPHGLQWHAFERQDPAARGTLPAPDARAVAPQRSALTPWTRPAPRTGLTRPYGGHGVPYRTPPQGWPEHPPF